MMTTDLSGKWLGRYIPSTTDAISEYQKLIAAAQEFERDLQSRQWTTQNSLHEWSSRAGELWAQRHNVDVLDRVRTILRAGVLPRTRLTASDGALEYQSSTLNQRSNLSDWTWEEDRLSQASSSRAQDTIAGRRIRQSTTTGPKSYECTAIPGPLIAVLGYILQEYACLPNVPLVQSSQSTFPNLIREVFIIFRAGAILHAPTDLETPVRLINDCTYLAGEIGLMALGMGHLGFVDIKLVLEETSKAMDSCGVQWRTRYLVRRISVMNAHWRKISKPVYMRGSKLPKGSV